MPTTKEELGSYANDNNGSFFVQYDECFPGMIYTLFLVKFFLWGPEET